MRNDFVGYPLRKDFDMSPEANQFPMTDEPESDWTTEYGTSTNTVISTETKHRLLR
jgi:NADH-quinone oxidoreductase subunit C/D